MSYENAAPCRHRGSPPDDVVEQVTELIRTHLARDAEYLSRHGLSVDEYDAALSVAVERLRGSQAASNNARRAYVEAILVTLHEKRLICSYSTPHYGSDTIYDIKLADGRRVAIIQKGCPDGKHSSTEWHRPVWADEVYLWWLCDSEKYHPGEHIWKGVKRVRRKVAESKEDQLDGIIFANETCGTPKRPCPKCTSSITINATIFPPPCIYVFPHWTGKASELNWRGEQERIFPAVLLSLFGIIDQKASNYISYIGFKLTGGSVRTEVSNRYGRAKLTAARG